MYKIGTLAKKTGYSPNLLRAWEKRHGFLMPHRGPGGQRLYMEEDLRLLLVVRNELQKGRSIGELARLGRDQLLGTGATAAVADVAEGQIAAVPQSVCEKFVHEIIASAASLEQRALIAALDDLFSRFSPDVVVYRVIPSVMAGIGDAWVKGDVTIAGEHMVSSQVEHRLRNLLEASGIRPGASSAGSPVICACFPDEEHRIGALSIAYFLARQGVTVLYLGSSLPFPALEKSIRQLRAGKVWLSVTRTDTLLRNRQQLIDLLGRNPQVRFTLGGQAMTSADAELAKAGCHVCSYPGSLLEIQDAIF